ncbi:DUF3592 domain-containing protein [Vitiosangium sp. GDMCC 1.1324]|uniref:DUF3592 domain-containing protein n=1 Tax=Vitiosangium sp. (strain GDMCC 1.1324) TaxID=2138576 RepID=UPI000D3554EB|nr:DUF3592 domain-containing protein [Vitiosangium sp. GDMCC 1.1324]PTL81195.1 hypothetical protein DAT35_24030 [Vitiosangium sp. GDMCC 1.1324]
MRGSAVTKRVLLGLVMLLFGGMLVFGGARAIYRAWASERWPVAKGSVLSSSVETLRSRRSVTFRPHVRYSYEVGSGHYTSDIIAFAATDTGNMEEAREYVGRFPAGSTVELHYEPGDPSVACLDCGRAGLPDYAVTVGGGALVLFAVSGLLELLRGHLAARRRQQRPTPPGATPQQPTRG